MLVRMWGNRTLTQDVEGGPEGVGRGKMLCIGGHKHAFLNISMNIYYVSEIV